MGTEAQGSKCSISTTAFLGPWNQLASQLQSQPQSHQHFPAHEPHLFTNAPQQSLNPLVFRPRAIYLVASTKFATPPYCGENRWFSNMPPSITLMIVPSLSSWRPSEWLFLGVTPEHLLHGFLFIRQSWLEKKMFLKHNLAFFARQFYHFILIWPVSYIVTAMVQ